MSDEAIEVGRLKLVRVAPSWLWFGDLEEELGGGRSRSTRVKCHQGEDGEWRASAWVDVFGGGMAVSSAGLSTFGASAEAAVRKALLKVRIHSKRFGLPELEVRP